VLTLTYGHPVSAYVPGHNLSHHKHTQTRRDVMRTTKVRFSSNLLNGLLFMPRVGGDILKADMRYFKAMYRRNPPWFRQMLIEFVVFGLFLVLGVFTPVSALLAALFQLNLLVATSGTTDWPGTYIIMAALLLAVSLSQAGRTLGLDAMLAKRNPDPRLPIY